MLGDIPRIETERLLLDAFAETDVQTLAEILAEPEVTRNITADGSSPERCLAAAEKRINWHNGSWGKNGYGVWAVRSAGGTIVPRGTLLGWCGFIEPDVGEDPEILYALAPRFWGSGLALEAARASVHWLFSETRHGGVSAIIFARLNPASIAIAGKLGMTRRGTMAMSDFLPDRDLALNVLNYEVWRLASGPALNVDALLFQAPFKAGKVATLDLVPRNEVEAALCRAAHGRTDLGDRDADEIDRQVVAAFRSGLAEPDLDWYHMPRPV